MERKSVIMYNHNAYIERALNEMLVDENKKDVITFCNELRNGSRRSVMTIVEYVILFRKMDIFWKKPFREATKDDMIAFIEILRSGKLREFKKSSTGEYIKPKIVRQLQESSLVMYQTRIKRFYQWINNMKDDEFPEQVSWMNTKIRNNHRKLPGDILTQDEIKKMAEHANDTKERALVIVLYESGIRVGELLNMKIKNVQFDCYGAVIRVDGKTGERHLRLINSAPDLQNWINHHPFKEDPDYPVWITIDKNTPSFFGKTMTKEGTNNMLKRLAKRAGIKKRVHPHLFRHTRFTHLAKDFSESEMKIMAGWSGGSGMPQTYIHLSGEDIEKKLLEKHGIIPKEAEQSVLTSIKCPRCGESNSSTYKFCGKCGMAIDLKAVMALEERRKSADDKMNVLLQDMIDKLGEEWVQARLKAIEEKQLSEQN